MNDIATAKKIRFSPLIIFVIGVVIIGLTAGGVYFFSKRQQSEEKLPILTEENQKQWRYFSDFYDIRDITFDGNTLWIASIAGLHKYDRKGNLLKTYTAADGLPSTATAVIKIGDKIYIGIQGGVAVLDTTTDKFNYLYDKTDHSLNGNIFHFEYDGQKLWMTTFGGLRSFNTVTSEWKNYGHRDSDFTVSDKILSLIERANPTSIIWSMNKATDQWTQEFQLEDYEWMYIDGNNRYVAAAADPKSGNQKNSVLYYKTLPDGLWTEIKLPISGNGLRYRKLTIGEDDKAYFTYQNSNENILAVYDLRQKEFSQYALGVHGDVSATPGSVYPDPLEKKIWLSSWVLSYFDFVTETAHYALPLEKPLQFSQILSARDSKLVVNTNVGVGVFDYQNTSFEKISSESANDAEWIDNTIWLDLSQMDMGGGEIRLGKYNTNNKTLEVKTLDQSFSFVKNQESEFPGSIILMLQIYETNKSTSKLVSFNFENGSFKNLLEIDSSSLSTAYNSKPTYSEQYGILINMKDGIWSFNPKSKEYKLLLSTSFIPIFTRTIDEKIVVLSDTGVLYRWDGGNSTLISIWSFHGPQFSKPSSFEIYKNQIALKSVEQLPLYNPGATYEFGPAGYSFYLNKLILLNFVGSLETTIDGTRGMMRVDFSNETSDGDCLWFQEYGIWAYCK